MDNGHGWLGPEPVSTITSAAYILGGVALVVADQSAPTLCVAAVITLLGIFTGLFHADWSRATADLDHAGMIATLVMMAGLATGATWWLALLAAAVAAVGVAYVTEGYNHSLIGVLALLVTLGAASEAPMTAVFGLGYLGVGLGVWYVKEDSPQADIAHGLWHMLTAAGLTFLYAGIAGFFG